VVDGIGIVPENPKIICFGFHGRQTVDHFIGVDHSGRVAVAGHAPNSLDTIIVGHQFLDLVHVGAGVVHCYGNHINV